MQLRLSMGWIKDLKEPFSNVTQVVNDSKGTGQTGKERSRMMGTTQ